MKTSVFESHVSISERRTEVCVAIAFGIFIVLALHYQFLLLDNFSWGDEAETIVGAKLIAAGSRLYSEIYNPHGPLTFLPGVLLELVGSFKVQGHRVFIALLQIAAMVAIYRSPLINGANVRRIYVGLAATITLLYLPEVYGHSYVFQVMAGLLLVIIIAQYVLPAIANPAALSRPRVILGNALIACLPFLAITYVPIAGLLFLCALRKPFYRLSITTFVIGILANIIILAALGSIPGYFAFHIYLNMKVLPFFTFGQDSWPLVMYWRNAQDAVVANFQNFALMLLAVATIVKLSYKERGLPWRSLLLALGISSLIVRGLGFHGIPYYYCLLVLPLTLVNQSTKPSVRAVWAILGVTLICFAKLSLSNPNDAAKMHARKIPEATEFTPYVKEFTGKKDRIIAYSFQNHEYIAADRLPASGHYFYLPWQEKYNENPQFGIKIDACKDIEINRPKIMMIDKAQFGAATWDSYGKCVQSIIDRNYTQIPNQPIYLLNSIKSITGQPSTALIMFNQLPSKALDLQSPLNLNMLMKHQSSETGLKRISVQFATYLKRNPGEAELRLKGADGTSFTQRFMLPDVRDNQYQTFELDGKRYTSGEIVALSGGGVSTWDSHSSDKLISTCIVYHYTDSTLLTTPGCAPL